MTCLCVSTLNIACKEEDPPPLTEEQQTLKNLAKTWTMSSATVDGMDVAEWFEGLKVSFKESKAFTVENAVPPIWITSGSFVLEKAGANYVIRRSDGIDLLIMSLNEASLTISMSYIAEDNARTTGISGSYTFILSAN